MISQLAFALMFLLQLDDIAMLPQWHRIVDESLAKDDLIGRNINHCASENLPCRQHSL